MYAGFPVVSERRDGKVYYRFLDSFKLGDVPFTADEILALAFGEDLLRALEGTVFHDSIQSALSKIRAGLSEELGAFLGRLAESFRVLPGPHKRYADYRRTIQTLNDAVLTSTTVEMIYRTGRTGEESSRQLDPYRIWYRGGSLYVIGHDHRSREIRTFAIDRIREIAPAGKHFEIPDSFDFDAYTASGFGVVAEPASHVRIRFAPSWASHIREHCWHASQQLSALADGGVEMTLEVGTTAELTSWLLSFGPGAEVLEPAPLRAEVRQQLEAALKLYS